MVFWLVILCSFAKGQGAFTNAMETFDAAWRIIEETHYDRDFNGVDWKKVRDELRPRAERARTRMGDVAPVDSTLIQPYALSGERSGAASTTVSLDAAIQ